MKSILTSTKLLEKERADQVLDIFIRDHEFRRTTPVFITRDPVMDVLNTEPEKEVFPAIQIKALSDNYQINNTNPRNLTVGDMSQYISEKKSFLIPGISMIEGMVKSYGAGIIEAKSSQYIGWIDVEDMEGVRYMHNNVQGGFINLDEEKLEEGPVVLEIKGANTTFKTKVSGDDLEMKVQIKISSMLAEDWGVGRNVFKKSWKKELEKAANKTIKGKVERILELAQQEYQTDFLNVSKWVYIHEPKYWEKHEKDWDQHFSELDISVEVNTEITDFGTQNFNAEEGG
ncbi:Ger(x)C family spore germination protein [Halobacillus dabanensis]|nr:Ger(x)C family spore germination protein [Halobacillus dabanensis]